MNYYNDNDPLIVEWLKRLIQCGLIPIGKVDDRSIKDIKPSDLKGFAQCHFFAGIGGWSYALALAGWPGDRPVWTGSCPCQPFSVAGKGQGVDDDRHLWPAFRWLIAQGRPAAVFGEQVASKSGREWLSGVRLDLEAMGYEVGGADLCAAGVGAPNIRQRLWWVADTNKQRIGRRGIQGSRESLSASNRTSCERLEGLRSNGRLANTQHPKRRSVNVDREDGCDRQDQGRQETHRKPGTCREVCGVADPMPAGRTTRGTEPGNGSASECCSNSGMGNSVSEGPQGRRRAQLPAYTGQRTPWETSTSIQCRDGKLRRIPIEPIFQFTFARISTILGHSWDIIADKIKKWIMGNAKKTKTGPREILRAMWSSALSASIQWNAGGYDAIQEPQILLIALCKLARDSQYEFKLSAQDITTICQETMRALWLDNQPACPSQERGLDGSQPREPSDALHCVPFVGEASQEISAMHSMWGKIEKAQDVPETFSALEKIWRSILDESAQSGDIKRLQIDKDIFIAASGFPLSKKIPKRVGLLRGAGNSINPWIAAEFIRAYMEAKCTK